MSDYFQVTLTQSDFGQLLDGLRIHAEAWNEPVNYLESGFTADGSFTCEECSDPHEARRLAQYYEKIIACAKAQVEKQGGWR